MSRVEVGAALARAARGNRVDARSAPSSGAVRRRSRRRGRLPRSRAWRRNGVQESDENGIASESQQLQGGRDGLEVEGSGPCTGSSPGCRDVDLRGGRWAPGPSLRPSAPPAAQVREALGAAIAAERGRAAAEPVRTVVRPKDRRPRPKRWADALAELRALQALDDRLRAVEVAFGKGDQHLETFERTILPSPADDWAGHSPRS